MTYLFPVYMLPPFFHRAVTTAFFMNTWEEYHIREFILPLVNGPSEGLMGTTVLFLVTAWRGASPLRARAALKSVSAASRLIRPSAAFLRLAACTCAHSQHATAIFCFARIASAGQRVWHDEPTTFGALVPLVRPVLDRFRLLAGVSLAEPVTNVELLSVCAGLFLIVTCVMNSLTVCRYYIARNAPLSSHFTAFCESVRHCHSTAPPQPTSTQHHGGIVCICDMPTIYCLFMLLVFRAGGTLPMWLLLGAGSRWLFEARLSPVAAAHPHVWFMAGGAIFAEFTSRLMISHVCDQSYAPAYWPIALFGLAPALETLRAAAPTVYSMIAGVVPAAALEPQALLFASAVAALAHLAFFFSTSVRTIAATLDIDVFDTTKQRTRAAEAAARKST